jgi:hypothetical protein
MTPRFSDPKIHKVWNLCYRFTKILNLLDILVDDTENENFEKFVNFYPETWDQVRLQIKEKLDAEDIPIIPLYD